jgi:hypothetical protein
MLQMPLENRERVVQFLEMVSSTPRPLKSRCCMVVSDQLGCHGDRKTRTLQLGLPMKLTSMVLFLDVLYPYDGHFHQYTSDDELNDD